MTRWRRPLAAALERCVGAICRRWPVVANGGALLTPTAKQRLIDAKPGLIIIDGVGSSETGRSDDPHVGVGCRVDRQVQRRDPDTFVGVRGPRRDPRAGSRRHRLAGAARLCSVGLQGRCRQDGQDVPGHRRRAVSRCPATAPPSSRRRLDRTARAATRSTINSGGEKIFVEEVETAVASHPAVADVVVSGRPSERWGQEVVAIVALVGGRQRRGAGTDRPRARTPSPRYKLPKAVVFQAGDRAQPRGQRPTIAGRASRRVSGGAWVRSGRAAPGHPERDAERRLSSSR